MSRLNLTSTSTSTLTLALNFIGAAACMAALGGCAATGSPEWDARFGDRLRILRAQQVIDAAATGRNAQAIPPSDGRTVRESSERHVEGYRTPSQSSVVGGVR